MKKSSEATPRKFKVQAMEVCVDSIESAINATSGGATRLELCAALSEGGLTPTPGMLTAVKSVVEIPVFVMLRPRCGDFVYSQYEVEAMKTDASILKEHGADGFVFGALTPCGQIDRIICTHILRSVSPLPATFHRAFDVCRDVHKALSEIIDLGFTRILTSGQESTAEKGIPLIRELVISAGNKITIVPGAGITKDNLENILSQTGAVEFHASAKVLKKPLISPNKCQMGYNEENVYVASAETVREMVRIAGEMGDGESIP